MMFCPGGCFQRETEHWRTWGGNVPFWGLEIIQGTCPDKEKLPPSNQNIMKLKSDEACHGQRLLMNNPSHKTRCSFTGHPVHARLVKGNADGEIRDSSTSGSS